MMIFPTDSIAAALSSFDVALVGTSVSSGVSLRICNPKMSMAAAKMCAVRTGRNLHINSRHLRGQTQRLSGSLTGTACHHPYLNLS